jgi:pyruvate ferredoxin oxidoreductase beta subunit
MQRSGGTPIGARTTTTPAGKTDAKKDIDAIIAAHDPPYMATACSSYPQDIFKKVQKALSFRGPTFIHILVREGKIKHILTRNLFLSSM